MLKQFHCKPAKRRILSCELVEGITRNLLSQKEFICDIDRIIRVWMM